MLQSPLYKFGKWVISTVVLAGIIIWVGGSVYSGVQIKSIRDQSNETLSEIRTLAYSVSEANEKVRAFLTTKFSEVTDLANSSKAAIKRSGDSAALAFQNEVVMVCDSATKARSAMRGAADSSIAWIDSERARAKALLDVDRLPDLRTIREQISQLDQAGGNLNLQVMRSLLRFWFWVFLVFAAVPLGCLVITVFLWRKMMKT